MKRLLLLVLGCWVLAFNLGMSNSSPIDGLKICEHIKVLASDEYEGRQTNTEGEQKTINYIQNQYKEIGLQPMKDGSYLQKVHLAKYNVIPPSKIKLTNGDKKVDLEHTKDFYLESNYSKERIEISEAEVVFAGFGIHAPEIGWDDYKDVDVKGKIVIVISDVPSEFTEDTLLWKGDPAANIYSKSFYKKNEAARRGAIGMLSIYKHSKQGYYTWETIKNYIGVDDLTVKRKLDDKQLKFSGVLSRAAVSRIFDESGKKEYDYQSEALKKSFKPFIINLKANFTFSNTWEDILTHNVIGILPGTDLGDEAMVYSAHWDHVGIMPGTDGDNIRNGAVDNASGTAALIELARAYKTDANNRRSIVFVATGAEEIGLLGSVWYNANPVFPIGKTVANFNMDSHYPYGKVSNVTAVVYGRSDLDKYLEESARRQGRVLTSNREQNIAANIFFRSDHFPFVEVGIPSEFAVGYGEAIGHDNEVLQQKLAAYQYKYHQPNDEYEEDFDCGGIVQDAELIYVAGQLIDRDGAFPEWYSGQPFAKFRKASRYSSDYFDDVSKTHLPLIATQGRSMDAKPSDLDGDGDLDMIVTGEYSYNLILINDGYGKFTDESTARLPMKRYDTEDIAVADFDLDGDQDILFVSEDNFVNEYYLNDGSGFFVDHSYRMPVDGKSNAVNTFDINGDQYPDIIIGNDGINFCLINDKEGGWINSPERIPASAKTTQDIEIGDVNGDGHLDILCGNENDNEIWINDGNGFFRDETSSRISNEIGMWETRELDLADVDNDGDLDIFLANVNFIQTKDHQNRLFLNDGEGKFMDATNSSLPQEKMHSVDGDLADLDRDGHIDIITSNGFGNSLAIYMQNANLKFENKTDVVLPASIRGDIIDTEIEDFNNDGLLDIYLCNFRGSDMLILGKKG